MNRYEDAHSKLVARAKVILPLASLVLLVTLFLFSKSDPYELTIPYARVDIETLAREQRLENPAFSTVTSDGAELNLKANLVRPDLTSQDVVNSNSVSGSLALPDGSHIKLTANDAVFDGPSRIAELSGNVIVESSAGYVIKTDRIASLLDISRIESAGEVVANGPAGQITAGTLEISQNSTDQNYQMLFKNGVKLVYQP